MGDEGQAPTGGDAPVGDEASAGGNSPGGSDAWVAPGETPDADRHADAAADAGTPASGAATADEPRRRRRWTVVAAAVVVVAGAAAGAAMLGDGDGGGAGDDVADTTTTNAAPPTSRPARPWSAVTADDGTFSLEVPPNWTFSTLVGDPAAIAARLYPEAPGAARGALQMLTAMQCDGCHSIAVDTLQASYVGLPNMFVFTQVTGVGVLGLDVAVDGVLRYPSPAGMVAGQTGRIAGGAGELAWLDFSIPPDIDPDLEVHGRHYFLVVGEDLWWFTYMSPWQDPELEQADRIALSFMPVPPA